MMSIHSIITVDPPVTIQSRQNTDLKIHKNVGEKIFCMVYGDPLIDCLAHRFIIIIPIYGLVDLKSSPTINDLRE